MRKSLTLSIPEPCHEKWDNMTPVKEGRLCAACTKTVYDFTNKTSEDIVKAFLENENLCGRFKSNQLNKELVYSRKATNSFRTFLASGLFSFLSFGTHEAFSQEKPILEKTDTEKQPIVKGKQAVSVLNNKVISGTIADENGLPLPGVNIIIKGTTIGTQTDFDGNYKITVEKGQQVSYSFLGYITKDIVIGDKSRYNFSMEIDELNCDNIIIAGFPESNERANCEKRKRKAKRKIERHEKREKIRNGDLERSKLGTFFYKLSHPFKKQN